MFIQRKLMLIKMDLFQMKVSIDKDYDLSLFR